MHGLQVTAGGYMPQPTMIEPTPEESRTLACFIRDGLGCGCPDEILSDLQIEPQPDSFKGLPIACLIKVGGRLLVAISFSSQWSGHVDRGINLMLEAGMRLRDQSGYNRFRLVVAAHDSQNSPQTDQIQSGNFVDLDDRIHLHVVRASELPRCLTHIAGLTKKALVSGCD